MKRLPLALALLLAATPAFAKSYTSDFGFTFVLPDDWSVFSREEMRQNPDLFDFDDPHFAGMDRSVVDQIAQKVKTGTIEFYYHYGVGSDDFTDNINVIKQIEKVPAGADDVKDACAQLPEEFAKYMGRKIAVYQCRQVQVAGKNALFLDFEGVLPGTRSIQYQIQKSDNIALIMTGTFALAKLDQERQAMTAMVQGMTIP